MMHEWFNQIVGFVDADSLGRAIAFAILGGLVLTQWIKFQFSEWLTDAEHARYTRAAASLMSFSICLILVPIDMKVLAAVAVSVVTGLAVPAIYWLGVKVLYHYFPWLDDVLSARPESTKDYNA